MAIELETQLAERFLVRDTLSAELELGQRFCDEIMNHSDSDAGWKGWVRGSVGGTELDYIHEISAEIRTHADVLVVIGVGGSNQAARAVIQALSDQTSGPEILYAGNSLSAAALSRLLRDLEGRSVYINVIAKSFDTLEPGSHYRVLRGYMRQRYSKVEVARRTILTGTVNSHLYDISKRERCRFLEFPVTVGGRYSAFTAVGLLPIEVAGLNVDEYLRGRSDMMQQLSASSGPNAAVRYAAIRHALLKAGYKVEVLTSFEPDLMYLSKWWWQLFGESEGKNGTGIFPSVASYSEDLHSIGQYLQDGQRILIETFVSIRVAASSVRIEPDPEFEDRFDYLDGLDLSELNRIAEEATLEAHVAGGVPCMRFIMDELDEYHIGQLLALFMVSCAVSGKLLSVNPFDQEGVEQYKRGMFKQLGRRT